MFIFNYGSQTYKYSSKRPKEIICHNCKEKGQTFINKYLKYFYTLYIPIFSYRFWTEYECVRCTNTSEKNQLSKENKDVYKSFTAKSILPIWTFSGLIAILVIPVTIWVISIKNKQDMLSQLDSLQINQKFDFKTENGNYSMFKICKIEGDNISVIYNNLETTNENGLIGIDYKKNYSKDTLILNLSELKDWVKNDRIIFISK